jgi:1-acylglycerone phosphate reductase
VYTAIYQASKAALIAASEGWRLEMAPLGVRVITLVTGGVATNFLANLESITLPEDSYYRSIKAMIEEQPDRVPLGMEPEAFAMDVLRRVENGSSGKFWVGGGSIIARWAAWIFPQSALVSTQLSSTCLLVLRILIRAYRTWSRFGQNLSQSPWQRNMLGGWQKRI